MAPGGTAKRLVRSISIFALGAGSILVQAELQAAGAAGPCDPPIVNVIACENTRPGNPASQWDVSGAGSSTIQGFATEISVNRGETVRFKVRTSARAYRLDIYRLGFYGGSGARKVTTVNPSVALPQSQPSCLSEPLTGLIDCGNWRESAQWAVPADAVSGVYLAVPVRSDTGAKSHIVFIVRDDTNSSDLLFQTSDSTWQAYNNFGGNSLYAGSPAGRAYKVSYNRPFSTRACCAEDWLFNAEYPAIRWLEANGYDVSYSTDVDSERRGGELLEHNVFMSVGHDEYWSAGQRVNVEAARNAGVHLAFWSGNEVFWKTRWENSISAGSAPYRTIVSYKETHANAPIDPADPPIWTGTWRDPRFSPPADGGRPENALTGTIFTVNAGNSTPIRVPHADGRMRLWRNTNIATLPPGGSANITPGTIGYEWDEDLDNGFRPPGLIRVSSTVVDGIQKLLDHGSTYGTGQATHNLTLYRHPSGALVFGAGTVQWSWALDGTHDRGGSTPDSRAQQAMVNLFADMGVQPGSLRPGLVPATASTDTAAPSATTTAPTSGAAVQIGTPVTIRGTATDSGGGQVGGVEVSTDGGATWHPAAGREAWAFVWTPTATGSVKILSRATDDSGNYVTPTSGVTVTVVGRPCPCTIFAPSSTPGVVADPDQVPIEVGVKFRSDVNGWVTGVRFYKATSNTGAHVGNLWSATGTRLATVTFAGESASGWQQANFAQPVAITAGTTYVASYHTTVGRYSADVGFFNSGVDSPPLHALANGTSPNGVYTYSSTSTFPTSNYQASNYWVDVVFTTSP